MKKLDVAYLAVLKSNELTDTQRQCMRHLSHHSSGSGAVLVILRTSLQAILAGFTSPNVITNGSCFWECKTWLEELYAHMCDEDHHGILYIGSDKYDCLIVNEN